MQIARVVDDRSLEKNWTSSLLAIVVFGIIVVEREHEFPSIQEIVVVAIV